MKEYIICSAIHFLDGKTYSEQPTNIQEGFIIYGRRHSDCYISIAILTQGSSSSEAIQKINIPQNIAGFITNTNKFLDRKESYTIALNAGQIKENDSKLLISEDLY